MNKPHSSASEDTLRTGPPHLGTSRNFPIPDFRGVKLGLDSEKLSPLSRHVHVESRLMRIRPAAPFLVVLSMGSIAAQSNLQQGAPVPSTSMQTEAASIYVTVATKKGMLIRDLKPDGLTVVEDKVPAKIEKVTCGKPEPLLIGVLVDVSGSRRGDSHVLSHYDELQAFLDHLLSGGDGAFLIAFDKEIYRLSELMSGRAEISSAFDKLRKHKPQSSTALYDAIKAAAEANLSGRSGRRVILVLGDWEDNSSHIGIEDAEEAAQRSAATIYAIVDSDIDIKSKKTHRQAVLAATEATEQTGGLAYEVHDKYDFAKGLQAIGSAVTGSCRVEYTTAANTQAKKGTKVRVEANSKDVSVIYPRVRFGAPQ